MTDLEILKKAIDKAGKKSIAISLAFQLSFTDEQEEALMDGAYKALIFDHDFARAFFGVEIITQEYVYENRNPDYSAYSFKDFKTEDRQGMHWFEVPKYKFHLMKMVLEPEPLQYLERFL